MPEGHSIHRLALAFGELFGGRALGALSPQGRFSAGAGLIDSLVLRRSEAYGKQLFLGFGPGADDGDGASRDGAGADGVTRWLRVHLGLYGAWTFSGDEAFSAPHSIGAPRRRVGESERALPTAPAGETAAAGEFVPPPPRGAVRLRLLGQHGCADLAGPSACEVLGPGEKLAAVRRLGPDPLRAEADGAQFARNLLARKVGVGALLMDQGVLAGVGNIYRAEALFRAGLNPYVSGARVPEETALGIWADLVVLMRDGVERGRIVTTGDDEEPFFVYRRPGEPCRVCGTAIAEAKVAARRLFWCPVCQA